MMLELVIEIFSPEAQLSPEGAELGRRAAAVRDDNWVRSMSTQKLAQTMTRSGAR
jgi:hypothetical protein